MAAPRRRKGSGLATLLAKEPHRFDFHQAVRLLEQIARQRRESEGGDSGYPVGEDQQVAKEATRFKALSAHIFPPGDISTLRFSENGGPAEMTVNFIGLTGPSGVLPHHYTQTIIERLRKRDTALRDFFDLFNHRVTSLFHRAWEKYRIAAQYERAAVTPGKLEDAFTHALFCLVGLGATASRKRVGFPDEAFLYYSGYFSHNPRNCVSLEQMLEEFWKAPVTVQQFQGQWLHLALTEQSSMPSALQSGGCNNRLGVDTIVGEKVWSEQSKFRIRLGPLSLPQFRRFLPSGANLEPLCQMTRSYVGLEFDFDVQPVLRGEEAPPMKLDADSVNAPRLGWNTWLLSQPLARDADDAIFSLNGDPHIYSPEAAR